VGTGRLGVSDTIAGVAANLLGIGCLKLLKAKANGTMAIWRGNVRGESHGNGPRIKRKSAQLGEADGLRDVSKWTASGISSTRKINRQ